MKEGFTMQSDEGLKCDNLTNVINSAGSKISKSLPTNTLKLKVQELRDFCNQLLALLPD
jgi:hypothetical protein